MASLACVNSSCRVCCNVCFSLNIHFGVVCVVWQWSSGCGMRWQLWEPATSEQRCCTVVAVLCIDGCIFGGVCCVFFESMVLAGACVRMCVFTLTDVSACASVIVSVCVWRAYRQ